MIMNDTFILTTPIVLFTFNRLEQTKQVFEKIREFRPKTLYLVSDAARKDRANEHQLVLEVRKYLESHVDWDCDVKKIYADENMGCAKRISSALDQVFEKEESAIMLEDDCVPNDSFFEFCQHLLRRYRDNDQVLSICGSTVIDYSPSLDKDYYFTKRFGCCGWATWKRAWALFDYNMSNFDKERKNPIFRQALFNRRAYWNMMAQFEALAKGEKKFSWAYIFYYCAILNGGYHIYPKYNLIKNIGFIEESTHTPVKRDYYVVKTEELSFPLKDREKIEWEKEYDAKSFKLTQRHGWVVRIKQILGLDINESIFDKLNFRKRNGRRK